MDTFFLPLVADRFAKRCGLKERLGFKIRIIAVTQEIVAERML